MKGQLYQQQPVSYDEFINVVATYWYFLYLKFNSVTSGTSNQLADELIDTGILLKSHLQYRVFTCVEPMNVCVDPDTFFDVWLDQAGDIQVGELYSSQEESPQYSGHRMI